MDKENKWLVFLFLISVIVGAIFSAVLLTQDNTPSTETSFVKKQRCVIVTPSESEPSESSQDDISDPSFELSPFPVAEPLEGVELYQFYVEQINEQYYPNVPVHLVMAIMKVESNYQPNVGSNAGAVGLMQVIPRYHQHRVAKYCLNDLWDPYTNIICAMDLLNERYEVHGNWRDAIYDYNHSWSYVDHVLQVANDILKGG